MGALYEVHSGDLFDGTPSSCTSVGSISLKMVVPFVPLQSRRAPLCFVLSCVSILSTLHCVLFTVFVFLGYKYNT